MSTPRPAADATPEPTLDLGLDRILLLPYLLNRLTSRSNQLWLEQIRDKGLTIPRWQVLVILRSYNGCKISTLVELSGAEQPILSRVIDQMERDNLVERRKSEKDQRIKQVWVTEKGRNIHDSLMPAAEDYVYALAKPLNPEERNQLISLLNRMVHA